MIVATLVGCFALLLGPTESQQVAGEASPSPLPVAVRGEDLLNLFERALQPTERGSVVFAGVFRQDRISAEDCESVLAAARERLGAGELIEFLERVGSGTDLQEQKDVASTQAMLFERDGSYYLHKYIGGGLTTCSAGNTDWKYYANGKRTLEVTAVVGMNGKATVTTQLPGAVDQVWMKGLAKEALDWLRFMRRHAAKVGRIHVLQMKGAGPHPVPFGLKLPIWRSLVHRVTMVVEYDPRCDAATLTISLLDEESQELTRYSAVLAGGALRRVSSRSVLPTTSKIYSQHGAVVLDSAVVPMSSMDALAQASGVAYIVDETDVNRRLYLDDGIPDDLVAISQSLQQLVLRGEVRDPVAGGRTFDETATDRQGMAMLEFYPRNIRIGEMKNDGIIDAWLVNGSAEPVEIIDGGPSCGCLQMTVGKCVVPPWQSVPMRILVRHADVSPERGGERITFVCMGPLGRGTFVVPIAVDKH